MFKGGPLPAAQHLRRAPQAQAHHHVQDSRRLDIQALLRRQGDLQGSGRPLQQRPLSLRVQDGRRVDGTFLPTVTNGGTDIVRATHAQVVARVAADEARLREARVEVELLAQLHERGPRDARGLDRGDGLGTGHLGEQGQRPDGETARKGRGEDVS